MVLPANRAWVSARLRTSAYAFHSLHRPRGCKWQTIRCFFSAVRHLHLINGPQSSPLDMDCPCLQLLLWGIICFFGCLDDRAICTPMAFDSSWHLRVEDVALDSHVALTELFLPIKASKTAHSGRVALPNNLYSAVAKTRPPASGWRWLILHLERFVTKVRWLLFSVGMDPSPYSGHSFHIGAVTTAQHAGRDAVLTDTGTVEEFSLPSLHLHP